MCVRWEFVLSYVRQSQARASGDIQVWCSCTVCVGLPVKVYPTFISFDDRNLSCYAGHRPSNKIHDLSYGKQNVPKIFNRDTCKSGLLARKITHCRYL